MAATGRTEMEGLLESSVPIAEAPELGARRLDDQDQALAVCQSVGLLLRLGGGDLELCQHHRVPGFSGSTQQTQNEPLFVALLLESAGSTRTVASDGR